MDLEEQAAIHRLVKGGQQDRMIVILGTPNSSSTQMVALTLTRGDPSYAGPLAGVPLGLAVYHILEDEVRAAIPADVYAREIGTMEFVLEKDKITAALERVRQEQR